MQVPLSTTSSLPVGDTGRKGGQGEGTGVLLPLSTAGPGTLSSHLHSPWLKWDRSGSVTLILASGHLGVAAAVSAGVGVFPLPVLPYPPPPSFIANSLICALLHDVPCQVGDSSYASPPSSWSEERVEPPLRKSWIHPGMFSSLLPLHNHPVTPSRNCLAPTYCHSLGGYHRATGPQEILLSTGSTKTQDQIYLDHKL